MAYCTVDDVAAELGVDLTTEQEARATTLIAAAQAWIDTYCMRTFEASTAITDERHQLYGRDLYLTVAPIASVQQVRTRYVSIGNPYTVLTVNTEYEVLDLATGHLLLPCSYQYRNEALVDYTPDVEVPADIADITAQIVAERMKTPLSVSGVDLPPDVERMRVGEEWEIERFTDIQIPKTAMTILATLQLHQRRVFV